jgi:ubiquinone/menaquinone biosynthesis C-methylase UbiE
MAGHPILAAVYDKALAANEEAGLRQMRADLLRAATGRTLEIGAGTGLNLEHYPEAVTELSLTEPDPHMAKRLRQTLDESSLRVGSVEVLEAGAEELPFEAASFDCVVSTLVLCSVAHPDRAVAEVYRVLKPEGRLLYIEHVRDQDGTRRARWQDRLERPWGWFLGGCHPNRHTGPLIAGAFDVPEPESGEMPGDDPFTQLIKPLIRGVARPLPARAR